MKRLTFYILTASATFTAGLFLALFVERPIPEPGIVLAPAARNQVVINIEVPLAIVDIPAYDQSETEKSRNPLDEIWVEADSATLGAVSVTRVCAQGEFDRADCNLTVRENGKLRKTFEIGQASASWLKFGFFDFLGEGNTQLIVHTYSGGAHCCHDYYIFSIAPRFRTIYDSTKYDSANEIGSELFPIDINSDGVFEFHRRIETFSYFHASYADSNKPTALFAYNSKQRKYDLANRLFPEYILADTQRALDWFKTENIELDERYMTRESFLNYVFSGNEKNGWEYYEKNYNFEDKDEYRRDVKKAFKTDPTYRSIYGK